MGKTTYPDGSTPSICIVGAGFSGLLAGIKLKTELGLRYTIFDENSDVGGTWLVNTYPGCACDCESHLYSYSFEPNPNWSRNYSPQQEIWEYLRNVAKKYDLYRCIEFDSQIKRLAWDETINQWRVTVYNKKTKKEAERLFDLVINSPGALRLPSIPSQFTAFKGPIVHSGAWDSSVEWENKVVAVIGSGSSAVQLIPELAAKAKELHCYQRKPAWVMPRRQFRFPEFLKFMFAYVPFLMLFYRWLLFLLHEIIFSIFLHGSKLSDISSWLGRKHMKDQIPENEKLREELLPQYRVGCKRIVVSNEYFPAMQRPNVKLHRKPIVRVKEHSIVTTIGEQEIDVLCLATGYQVQNFFDPMEILGKDSEDIMASWKKDGPRSYFGITSAVSPNQFILLGPNTGLGHNTIIFMIECQMNYVLQLIQEMMRRNAKVVQVKETTESEFQEDLVKGLNKTVWGNEKCGSWYANSKGIITTLWPYSCLNYWWKTRTPDYTQFNFY